MICCVHVNVNVNCMDQIGEKNILLTNKQII